MKHTLSSLFLLCSACSGELSNPTQKLGPVEVSPPQTKTEEETTATPLRYVYATGEARAYRPLGGKALGVLMAGARVPVYEEAKPGYSCKGKWLKIQLDAWICSSNTKEAPAGEMRDTHFENRAPHQRATTLRDTPVYDAPNGEKKRILPAGSSVRAFRITDFEGGSYAQISTFEYVDADALSYEGHRGWTTHWQGIELPKETRFPYVIFTELEVPLFATAGESDKTKSIGVKHRYEHGSILEKTTIGKKTFARVDEGWFEVKVGAVLIDEEPRPKDVPPGLPFVLVDVSDQTLVGYDASDELVFATLISGGRRNPTVRGNFGIERKFRYSTMAGNMFGEDYRVDDVPWATFFYRGYAIHGAFWHDKFGYKASHGCVNVAPADSMWLSDFLEPQLPYGWLFLQLPEDAVTSRVVVRE
jgi:lipoprotein-anchoring transpeptidase ErfK/SrfK